jgi:hypothetical protein
MSINNRENFLFVKFDDLKIGEKYLIGNLVKEEEYKGEVNTYFMESISFPGRTLYFVVREDGGKPFAVATNDCKRDNFDYFELAKILLSKGDYIITARKNSESNIIQFNIFKLLCPKVIRDMTDYQYVEVELVYQFNSLDKIPDEKFKEAITHAADVIGSDLDEQLLPKYCFNPNRIVTVRLFHLNEDGDVISYTDDGKRLILNANSSEYSLLSVNKNSLMRVFYSRKFKDSKYIFVDGRCTNPLSKWDLEDYVDKSHIDSLVAESSLKQIVTKNGRTFYAITNMNGELRLIYKSAAGYSSFPLNEYELEFISEIRDVKL